jgi:hypothetical protein
MVAAFAFGAEADTASLVLGTIVSKRPTADDCNFCGRCDFHENLSHDFYNKGKILHAWRHHSDLAERKLFHWLSCIPIFFHNARQFTNERYCAGGLRSRCHCYSDSHSILPNLKRQHSRAGIERRGAGFARGMARFGGSPCRTASCLATPYPVESTARTNGASPPN